MVSFSQIIIQSMLCYQDIFISLDHVYTPDMNGLYTKETMIFNQTSSEILLFL